MLAAVVAVTLAFRFAVRLAGLETNEEAERNEEDHAADSCKRICEEHRIRLNLKLEIHSQWKIIIIKSEIKRYKVEA